MSAIAALSARVAGRQADQARSRQARSAADLALSAGPPPIRGRGGLVLAASREDGGEVCQKPIAG
jgi:hypothetical protein